MGQVSGSISLDMTKVVRDVTVSVVSELVRKARQTQDSDATPAPLDIIVLEITQEVARLTSQDLLRIERKIDALTALVTAEARRHDRMTGTGELPAVANVGPYEVIVEPDRNSYEYQLPGPERESQ